MARGYDRQFTQLYQIDPSAYEGPSTFEGLADLVSAISESTAQQTENKRYADEITYRDERDAVKDADAQDAKDWQLKVFNEEQSRYTTEQQQLIKSKEDASRNSFYARAVKDYENDPLGLAMHLKSSGRFDGINSDTGATYADEYSLGMLMKQGESYNEIAAHLDANADPEQTTREEALDLLDTTDFSKAGKYGEVLRQRAQNILLNRDKWETSKLSDPWVQKQIEQINAQFGTISKAGKVELNKWGQTALKKVYDDVRQSGAPTTQYLGGLDVLATEFTPSVKERKGTYLYEGFQVSPVDDKGELTEQATTEAERMIQDISNGDPIMAEEMQTGLDLVEGDLSAYEKRELGEPVAGETRPVPMIERQQPSTASEDIKTRASISKGYSELPRSGKLTGSDVAKFIKDLGVGSSEIPSGEDLGKIVDFSLKNFGKEERKAGKLKVSVFNRDKLKDIQDYFYSLEQAAKDLIDRDASKDKEGRKREVESIFAGHINRLEIESGIYRDLPGHDVGVSSAQRTLDVSTTAFPGK